MRALFLYVLFVVIGTIIAVFVGLFVERQVSSAIGLVVFLALFFCNLATSWIAVIFAMDGSLKNAQGGPEQLEAESRGRPNPAG
jgi:hypothetical protein